MTFLPRIRVEKPVKVTIERAVVNSGFFLGNPGSLSILVVNGLNYVSAGVLNSHLVAAKVSGFDHALFGLGSDSGIEGGKWIWGVVEGKTARGQISNRSMVTRYI